MSKRNRPASADRQPAAPAKTPSARARLRRWIAPGAIALAATIALAPVLGNQFVSWDDFQTVARNVHFNPPSWDTLGYYWTHAHMHLWVPLTYTVWCALAWLSYTLTPAEGLALAPAWFHGANLLLHIGAALVVWRVLRRLVRDNLAAALGAILFAVHPVQVETVAWASGLKDLLCGLLMWSAIALYLRFAQEQDAPSNTPPGRSTVRWYLLGTLCFISAMLAKPTAMVTPILVIAFELLFLKRNLRRLAFAAGTWLLLAIPCMLWARAVQPPNTLMAIPPVYLRPLIATDALAFYLTKLIAPFNLAVDHGRQPEIVLKQGYAYWTWIVPALAAALLFWWHRSVGQKSSVGQTFLSAGRDLRIPLAAVIFLVCLAPVLGLVPFDFQYYSTVTEHYLYPAMVGPALLLAILISSISILRRSAFITATAAVLLLLAILNHLQARLWANNLTLFEHCIRVNPDSDAAHNSLASALTEAGELDPAVDHARRAIQLRPQNHLPYVTLAAALARRGDRTRNDFPAAIDAYKKAAQLDPEDASILAQLGGLQAMTGDTASAEKTLLEAIRMDPADAQAHQNLGTLYSQTHRDDKALAEMLEAVRLAPQSVLARTNAGLLLMKQGRIAEARDHFLAALRVNPDHRLALEALDECNRLLQSKQ